MAYVYTARMGCVTSLSADSKFWQVSNFTELHALTWAAHPYAQSYTALKAFIQKGVYMEWHLFGRVYSKKVCAWVPVEI